jgi:alkylation response protein AidB-like acyl-CoA dehydrogenase
MMDEESTRLVWASVGGIVADSPPDRALADLREFGWLDILLSEDAQLATAALFAAQGRHVVPWTGLDKVMLAHLSTATDLWSPIGLVLPSPGSDLPTSSLVRGTAVLRVVGTVAVSATRPDLVVVPALEDGELVIATGSLPAATPWPERGSGLDPDSGWTSVALDLPSDGLVLVTGPAAAVAWSAALAAGQRALAHELTALAESMLDLAVQHVSERKQFGVPLGTFQAVQHKLADVKVWVELAALAADDAWEESDPRASALAKILAGRAARTAIKNCQQVLGGMGFTWEHQFHRYLRRASVLEPLLGGSEQLRERLGASIIADGRGPRLVML